MRKIFNFLSKGIIFHRDFTVTPYRPTATLCTPNKPPYTRDEPGTDCGRWGARFASLRFSRFPPTATAHLHLPYICTYTLPGPDSECYPLTLNVAFSEANSSGLIHFLIRSRGERGPGVRTSRPRYWPVIRLGMRLSSLRPRRRSFARRARSSRSLTPEKTRWFEEKNNG